MLQLSGLHLGRKLLIFERIITFIVGALLISLAIYVWFLKVNIFLILILSILLLLVGIYFIAAALLPDRKIVKVVSDEALLQVIIEFPVKLVSRIIEKLGDLF